MAMFAIYFIDYSGILHFHSHTKRSIVALPRDGSPHHSKARPCCIPSFHHTGYFPYIPPKLGKTCGGSEGITLYLHEVVLVATMPLIRGARRVINRNEVQLTHLTLVSPTYIFLGFCILNGVASIIDRNCEPSDLTIERQELSSE